MRTMKTLALPRPLRCLAPAAVVLLAAGCDTALDRPYRPYTPETPAAVVWPQRLHDVGREAVAEGREETKGGEAQPAAYRVTPSTVLGAPTTSPATPTTDPTVP